MVIMRAIVIFSKVVCVGRLSYICHVVNLCLRKGEQSCRLKTKDLAGVKKDIYHDMFQHKQGRK